MYKLKSTRLAQLPLWDWRKVGPVHLKLCHLFPQLFTCHISIHGHHFRALFMMPNLCSSTKSMMLWFMVSKAAWTGQWPLVESNIVDPYYVKHHWLSSGLLILYYTPVYRHTTWMLVADVHLYGFVVGWEWLSPQFWRETVNYLLVGSLLDLVLLPTFSCSGTMVESFQSLLKLPIVIEWLMILTNTGSSISRFSLIKAEGIGSVQQVVGFESKYDLSMSPCNQWVWTVLILVQLF